MTLNDALAGVFRYKKETISAEECKELKQIVEQLENKVKALELTNS